MDRRLARKAPYASYQELADALYDLVAGANSASEQITRIQAAITTLHRLGEPIDRGVIERDLTIGYGESRPHLWWQTISRVAALADQAADPHDGAMIVLGAIFRDPYTIVRVRVGDVSRDHAIIRAPWSHPSAVPRELPAPLAAQAHRMRDFDLRRPFLLGSNGGRMSRSVLQHALQGLDAPASLFETDEDHRNRFAGPELDGRTLLAHLNPISLFSLFSQDDHDECQPVS